MPSKLRPPLHEQDHVWGRPDAPVMLMEFGDYQCPHCAKAHPVVKQLQEKYADKIKFAFRHFPMSQTHPQAKAAAIAAEAAGRQDKFWEMHDMIFEHQATLDEQAFLPFAQALQLDMEAFQKDLADESLAAKVEADFESGVRSGVNGTPSFYINDVKYTGDYSYYALSNEIEIYIAEKMYH
jgi:protein-disulfide isomerase